MNRTFTSREISLIEENVEAYVKRHNVETLAEFPVCIYARKSQEDEKSSIETQIEEAKDIIECFNDTNNCGIKLVYSTTYDIFFEDDKTGLSMNKRYQLQSMMRKIIDGQYVACFVLRNDRLSRNKTDMAILLRDMEKNYCSLISVYDPDYDELSTSINRSMGAIFAQDFVEKSRKNSMDAIDRRLAEGRAVSYLPYGYEYDSSKNVVIDEEKAEAVRKIYDLFIQGKSYKQICEYLNSNGYLTNRGKMFQPQGIRLTLANETYTGKYTFSRETAEKEERIRDNPSRVTAREKFEKEDFLPAIVDKEIFTTVQKTLSEKENTAVYSSEVAPYLLSKKMVCGCCGKRMTGSSSITGKNKQKIYRYCCPNSVRKLNCDTKTINAEYVENYVKSIITQCVNQMILAKPSITKQSVIVKLIMLKDSHKRVTKAIANLTNDSDKLLEKYLQASGIVAEKIAKRIEELELRKQEYERNESQIRTEIEMLTETLNSNVDVKQYSMEELFSNPTYGRQLVYAFIKEIRYDNDGLTVVLND